ncbi:hypothetical protein [Acetobacter sp.]|uniref:hypothetical protein n=1 Tax=Acetobacter sp. TaxID=440 RepID=UPI0039EC8382
MMTVEQIIGRDIPEGGTVYRVGDVVCITMPLEQVGIYEAHCAAAKHARGKIALDAMRQSLADFWSDHPDATELIAAPKRDNRAVRVTNSLLGFTLDGVFPVAWPDGQTRETCLYRMKRP